MFFNKNNRVIYVGRAANLRTRVSSYFSGQISNTRPAEMFIGEAERVSFTTVNNLLEAAVLENNLIKKNRPKYNIKDNDDRSFVYVFFDMAVDFPKPVIVRARDLARHPAPRSLIGPFQSQRELRNILSVARQAFPYSTCSPGSGKPCFHYQIGLCPGVCTGEIEPGEYKKIIRKLIRFLKSQNPKTDKKMINDISLLPGRVHGRVHYGVHADRVEGYDISYFKKGKAYGAMAVFVDGKPSKKDYRLFKIKEAKPGDDVGAMKEVLGRRLKHVEWAFPNLVVVDGGRQQVNAVKKVLESFKINIPVVGISKAGRHAQSAAGDYKLVFEAGAKKAHKDILSSRKALFQKVTAEAHRFAIKNARRAK